MTLSTSDERGQLFLRSEWQPVVLLGHYVPPEWAG